MFPKSVSIVTMQSAESVALSLLEYQNNTKIGQVVRHYHVHESGPAF
jgi:hypothetical protein